MPEWPEDALHTVSKKFIASMNLPQRRSVETNDSEERSAPQPSEHVDDVVASQIELDEFQSNLVRMTIYLYDTVKSTSKRYIFKQKIFSSVDRTLRTFTHFKGIQRIRDAIAT